MFILFHLPWWIQRCTWFAFEFIYAIFVHVLKVSACGDECFSTFSYVSSKNLGQSMQSHTDCICYIFLQCAFSNVSSNRLSEKWQSHIGCICSTFLHCVFSNVSSNCLRGETQSCIGCICLIFLYLYLCFSREHLHWHPFHWSHPSSSIRNGWQPLAVPCVLAVSNWEKEDCIKER